MVDQQRERRFLREQSDALGARVMQLQRQLVAERRANRRSRTTAALVQALYELAPDGRVGTDDLGLRCLRIIVDRLGVDCVAILSPSAAAYDLRCALGFGENASARLADQSKPPLVRGDDGELEPTTAFMRASGLNAALAVEAAAGDAVMLVGNVRAGYTGHFVFEADDRETLRVALSVYASIDELKRAEAALRASESRYRTIVNSVNDAILVVEPATGRIIEANDQVALLFGSGDAGFVTELTAGAPLFDDELGREVVRGAAARHRVRRVERVLVGPRGQRFWAEVALSAADIDGERQLLIVVRDISERRRAEEQLRHGSLHDALTGLPNRALIANRVDQALAKRQREPEYRFALLFIDLDRFKAVNDSLGHAVGDEVLTAVARLLEAEVRPGDTVARLSADEFVVLVEDLDDDGRADDLAGRLRDAIAEPIPVSGTEVTISASVGIALCDDDHTRWDELLRDSDLAMYAAKAAGRARQRLFDPSMHQRAVESVALQRELRRAITDGGLALHYQPVVALDDGGLRGFEALVRWQHPQRGLIPPTDFIPLAEDCGLIVPLGRWVLAEACRQLAIWHATDGGEHLVLSVNLSRWQLVETGLVSEVRELLETTGCPAHRLCLEITESAIMENLAVARATLEGLRDLGVRLSMDDFGTGYSSLSFLHRFPIDVLKIDRSFVRHMELDSQGRDIVRTIVTLGHALGLRVIAEGVESAQAVRELAAMGCEYGQGYFFARPLPDADASALITPARRFPLEPV